MKIKILFVLVTVSVLVSACAATGAPVGEVTFGEAVANADSGEAEVAGCPDGYTCIPPTATPSVAEQVALGVEEGVAAALANATTAATSQAQATPVPTFTPSASVASPPETQTVVSFVEVPSGPPNNWWLNEMFVGTDALHGLANEQAEIITATLESGEGLYLTGDPIGVVTITATGEIVEFFRSPNKGMVAGLFNASDSSIEVSLMPNNWRENADIWGIWGNIHMGEKDDFYTYVWDQQWGNGDLDMRGEEKPNFFLATWVGEGEDLGLEFYESDVRPTPATRRPRK